MIKPINVLIFPAGEINSVELHDALSTCVNIKLYGGSSVDRHGPYIFKNYISGIPFIGEESFFEKFNKVLADYKIDVIFPTHDTVTTFFTANQDKINAKIIAADKTTAEICRDKQRVYDLFSDCKFNPVIYINDFKNIPLPVFIKPRIGQGSVGAKKITKRAELKNLSFDDFVVSEYLPGEEYTVDCLTDKKGKLAVVSPRSRDRILAGVSVSGENRQATNEIQMIAESINKRLSFMGLWFFQVKKDNSGKFKLLEISTRCAGAMCLTRARGANLPLLSVYVALGYDITVILNPYDIKMDRTLISRYKIDYEFDNVYFDFDDTLIIDGKVHLYSIMFLYQCRNFGKKLFLLTKHTNDINQTLQSYAIDKNLFADVIHLTKDDLKVEKIQPTKSIFIDNLFQERQFVHDKLGIPVFDVDMLEVLIDWRV